MTDDRWQVAHDNPAARILHAEVTTAPLEDMVATARSAVLTDACGAIVCFEGIVRNHDDGHGVSHLTYSQHPSAAAVIADIGEDVASHHPGVRLWAAHRVGEMAVGELAFLVASASAHRAQAFAACMEMVDVTKERLPIWKKQALNDGRTQWVGTESFGA